MSNNAKKKRTTKNRYHSAMHTEININKNDEQKQNNHRSVASYHYSILKNTVHPSGSYPLNSRNKIDRNN